MQATLPLLPLPNALGSFEAYVTAVNRLPMLTPDEELRLSRALRDHDDLDAARQLVMSHLRLVVSIARNYSGYGLPQPDLVQEGNIGLMKAVKRFDPERGVRLVSFAMHWIRAEIHEYILRNWRLVKLATTKAQRKLFFNLRSLKGDSRAVSASDAEAIARKLDVRTEDVLDMDLRMSGGDIPLEPLGEDDDAGMAPIQYLADEASGPEAQITLAQRAHLGGEGLQAALSTLDPRSRHIVESRWLSDDGGPTLHELAAEYGVSAERIRQIESQAMKKLRTVLEAEAAAI
ncbi:MAG: RNA polymerase sigma factor RpoH [Betaproteobacteria bacterium]|jgi:RNA polymerase sigma-32 factor|nr:RNA polymerase sigma factor RpoH [Betaproteobacteria bacterium]NBY52522.1 RNA polymerase sigma factor RpoH [Betaproteobacteria bacterium]NCA23162.1 RNA polymerase sigma factor RpoH [Betaproteobacteria bacterium]NCU84538.1 RNA polymerase sigma factor RpoH [Betaproteobacteria bacterium]NCU94884.1 RNA polymerase sigma factor RpoH [Betaproteobacteria bacterium]